MKVYLEQALAMALPDTVVQHVSHLCQPAMFSAEDHRPTNRKMHPTKPLSMTMHHIISATATPSVL